MRKALIIGLVGAVLVIGAAAATTTAATQQPPVTSPVSAPPAIGQSDAGRLATDAVRGGQVTEIALVTVGGRPSWKAHVSTATGRHEVFVDAATGQILAVESPNGGFIPASPGSPATGAAAGPVTSRGGSDDGPAHDLGDDHGGHR
jgi:D-alanyl-D-alanine carboxypeptidase